jgi:hypothetical protein
VVLSGAPGAADRKILAFAAVPRPDHAPGPGYTRPSMDRARSVTFIIPVRNDAARLRRCLESVSANTLTAGRISIVVADNGSTDGSPDVAQAAGARVLHLPGLPVAALRNQAAAIADGEVLAFVDADHEIAADWCEAALEALGDAGVGAVGAPCHPPRDANWVQAAYDRFRARPVAPADIEWLGAGNMAMRASAFDAVGGFDTTLETCEDVDLCNRLRRAGHRIRYEPRMFNIHFGDPSSLRAVFMGELWRGRDNARVTLRGPLTLRALPSLLVPVGNLVLVVAAITATVVTRQPAWLAVPLVCFLAAVALRVARMQQHAPRRSWRTWLQNGAVGAAYELARTTALVVRASHRVRRLEPQAGSR